MYKVLLSLIIGLIVSAPLQAATTLYLDDRLDLLVLDGKKVAPSLLRGAGSLELENGLHQLVVRVDSPTGEDPASDVEIITINTLHISQLHFTLNAASSQAVEIGLRDSDGMSIPVVRDRLPMKRPAAGDCFEQATLDYNRGSGVAARDVFAQGQHALHCPTL